MGTVKQRTIAFDFWAKSCTILAKKEAGECTHRRTDERTDGPTCGRADVRGVRFSRFGNVANDYPTMSIPASPSSFTIIQ